MLRPYPLEPCSRLEPFSQTEPHHPVLLWPVEWMHDVHLADCVAQQVHPKRNSRATDNFPRDVADEHLASEELPEHGARQQRGRITAFVGGEASQIIAAHKTWITNEQRIQDAIIGDIVVSVPTIATHVHDAAGECEWPQRHNVLAIIRDRRDELEAAK